MELLELGNELTTMWGLLAPDSLRGFEVVLAGVCGLAAALSLLMALVQGISAVRTGSMHDREKSVRSAAGALLLSGGVLLWWWGPLTATVGKVDTFDPIDAVGQAVMREHPNAVWLWMLIFSGVIVALFFVGAVFWAVAAIRGDGKAVRPLLVTLAVSAAASVLGAWSWHMGYGGGWEKFCAHVPDTKDEGMMRLYENERASVCPPRATGGNAAVGE